MVDFMVILGIAFGITGFAHFGADIITPYIESNFPSLLKFSLTSPFLAHCNCYNWWTFLSFTKV